MAQLATIGQSVPRTEGLDKVTGRTRFTADIALPGLVWGKCLRSPVPHARIVSIDASDAQRLPGVHAVITAPDLPDVRTGRALLDLPVLARDVVRFAGEKLAAVAADSPSIAEEALALIRVHYEELPAVFDPVQALDPEAPRVHEDPGSYQILPDSFLNVASPSPSGNVISRVVHRRGDLQAGFAEADRIFEHTFTVPAVHHGYLEPHSCVVQVEPEGKITLWISNKTPFPARTQLARALDVPEEQIRVVAVPIGGDFGGKGSLMDAAVCYQLARRTGRPVKMVMTYREELMAANPRHDAVITLRTGVTNEGRITARQARIIFNTGAYAALRRSVTLPNWRACVSSYRVPHVEIETLCVYTNTVPRGYMRAPGGPQVIFATESHTDMIAHELGLDPLEFRLRNVLEDGDESALGLRWQEIRCKEALLAAAETVGWRTEKPPNVGRGIALFDKEPRPWPAEAKVSIDADALVAVVTAVPDTGTGWYTVLQQIVAEELQVPLAAVTVVAGDTDTAPYDAGIGASRVTHTAGQATLAATRQLKGSLLQLAGQLSGRSPEQLQLQHGDLVAADGWEMSLQELMSRAGAAGETPLVGVGSYSFDTPVTDTSFCVQMAEVEVDPETGQVKTRKLVTAHDVGTVLNPLAHQGQIEGGVVQGFGQALIEHLQMEDGTVTTLNLGDYKLPSMVDVPDLTTVLVEVKGGDLPYNGKHIGELSNVPTPAAIANAVFDAVGVRLLSLPITADQVFDELQGQAPGKQEPAPGRG